MNKPPLHFIISAPRSGSTWLATALNHHPQIFATEQRLFGRFCEVWQNNDGSTAPRITVDSYARAFGMHYFYPFLQLKPGLNYDSFVATFQQELIQFLIDFAGRHAGKSVIIDKVTPYSGTTSFVVQQIRNHFPESHIIQLVRDGRDVLTSGTFDWLLKDAAGTDRYRFFVERQPGMKLTRFFDDAVIDRWAHHWQETVQPLEQPETLAVECEPDASKASTDIPGSNSLGQTMILQVRFESMKENLPQELQRMFREIGVDDSLSLAEHCAGQTTFRQMSGRDPGSADPLAKARKGMVGDWKNYFTRADGIRFNQFAGRELITLGYEPDESWIDQLPIELELVSRGSDEILG